MMTNSFNVSAGIAILSLMCYGAVSVHGVETAVNLGTAEDFAILTKTGVTTTGVTFITGDIGTSPIDAGAITGFGLILDSSTTSFSTSSLVEGKVYASDYTIPTPAKLTTAIGDLGTAIVNAAGRTNPDFTELYSGDLTGAGVTTNKPALVPGLYKWGTSVQFTGMVTFKGSSTDIWILQIAIDLIVGAGANIILEGGALPENIFWQVSGKTTIGTTAHVEGILLCKTKIVFNSGSSLTGRALSQTAVTMVATTITDPSSISAIPSLLPSLLPSFVPSSLPSVLPSSLPSVNPSSLPSGIPSSLPSVSSSPSSLPSVIPSSLPSLMPSLLPSAVPSSLPTSSPTTSSPTTSCFNAVDNDNKNFDVNHSSGKDKGCKWLRNHPANIAEFCEVGKGGYLNCKETCCKLTCVNCDNPTGLPTTCVDLKQRGVKFDYTIFKSDGVTVKKEKTGKKCRNLAKESGANIEECCVNDMVNEGLTVANYCKATCDNCGDDSAAPSISVTEPKCDATDNDKIKFDVNHSSGKDKGCKWLRNHLSKIAECCEVGKGAYLNCKKTCESCD